jgi:hypothetical protein
VAAFDQRYVYAGVPPLTVSVTVPLLPPLQLTAVAEAEAVNAVGWVTVELDVFVQPFASVTVTVYVPATTDIRFCVVAAFDQA